MLHSIEANFDVPNSEVLLRVVAVVPPLQEMARLESGFRGTASGWTGSILPAVDLCRGENPVFSVRIGSIHEGAAFGLAEVPAVRSKGFDSLIADESRRVQSGTLCPFMVPDIFDKTFGMADGDALPGVQVILISSLSGEYPKKKQLTRFGSLATAILRGKTEDPTSAFEEMKAHIAQKA